MNNETTNNNNASTHQSKSPSTNTQSPNDAQKNTNSGADATRPTASKNKKPHWKYKKKKTNHNPSVGQDNRIQTAHKKNWNNRNKQFKSKINIPTHYLNELEKIAKAEDSTITDVTLEAVKQYILEKDKAKQATTISDIPTNQTTKKSTSLFRKLFGLK